MEIWSIRLSISMVSSMVGTSHSIVTARNTKQFALSKTNGMAYKRAGTTTENELLWYDLLMGRNEELSGSGIPMENWN